MATSTVILSGSPSLVDGHYECTFNFNPPSNISGRTCYLKVIDASIQTETETGFPVNRLYFMTMEFSQPTSFASINNAVGQAAPTDSRMVLKQSRNNVIAHLHTDTLMTCTKTGDEFDIRVYCWKAHTLSPQARILVEVLDGYRQITVNVYATTGTFTVEATNVSLMMEITPIDSEDEIDLSI